jgi:hypothetical protein
MKPLGRPKNKRRDKRLKTPIGLIWLWRVASSHECGNETLGLPKPIILISSEQEAVSEVEVAHAVI